MAQDVRRILVFQSFTQHVDDFPTQVPVTHSLLCLRSTLLPAPRVSTAGFGFLDVCYTLLSQDIRSVHDSADPYSDYGQFVRLDVEIN